MSLPPKFLLPVFFLVLFLGAMVLGPLIYFTITPLIPIPFHRAMDRALLISALAAMALAWPRIPLRRYWPWDRAGGRDVLLGLLIAAVSAQAMIGIGLAADAYDSVDQSAGQIFTRIGLALLAALIVPLIEETLFRGFLQGELAGLIGWRGGWIITAVIFALAHFVKIPWSLDSEPVHFWSGITALGAAFASLGDGAFLSGKGFNLLLIGLILGGIVLRSGSLWINYGLHGGWVFLVLLWTGFTKPSDHPHVSWLGGEILSSTGTSVVLLLLGLWLWRFYRNPSDTPEAGENPP